MHMARSKITEQLLFCYFNRKSMEISIDMSGSNMTKQILTLLNMFFTRMLVSTEMFSLLCLTKIIEYQYVTLYQLSNYRHVQKLPSHTCWY